MSNDIIETIQAERTSLDLHVDLCAQRYTQLLNRLDQVDAKFEKIETILIDIKQTINSDEKTNNALYLKWAGVIIGILAAALVGIATPLLLK